MRPTITLTISSARVRRRPLACVAAVAQHDEPVRHFLHFFDEVRDVDDGVALRLEAADQFEQAPHVVAAEAARRLVEDQHAAADGERARDLDELLRRRRERADQRVWSDIVAPQFLECGSRGRSDAVALHDAEARGFDAEHDVLHHAQVRRQRQLLVDHRHAGAARLDRLARRVRRAFEPHLARIRPNRAGQDGHQRALARAVLADQRAHLARPDGEIHAVQRHRGAERLPHAAHLEARRGGQFFSHRARSGCRSSFASGSFMCSRVTSRTPVSIRFSTASPLRCATIVFTPR